MIKRTRALAAIAALGLLLAGCSKCDMAGWLKSCGDAAPKAWTFPG